MGALFASVGLGATGYIATVTVAPLVAQDMMGATVWIGVPVAASVVGTAAGTAFLSYLMARRGRRFGLVFGYFLGALAAAGAVVATVFHWFPLLLVALFVFGAGFGSNYLARYAAADLFPVARQASAISWVVWAGTIGAVLGPTLMQPAQRIAENFGATGLIGAYLIAVAALVCAGLVMFFVSTTESFPRLDNGDGDGKGIDTAAGPRPWRELLQLPGVKIALLAMVAGQGVMVLIMAMTPVHIRDAGQSLASVGVVISAHTLGMFAFSPVSGWLSDHVGRIPMIVLGALTLMVAAVLAVFAEGNQQTLLATALFLLGLGWNFGFVAGSALLTECVAASERIALQGLTDTAIRLTATVASLASGVLIATWGYPALSLVGGLFALLPLLAVTRHWLLPAPAAERV